MTELKANGTCDFCGEACNADMPGAKAYDCEDFPMALTGTMSYGAWGACPSCAALIDSENWDALEKHMTAIQRRRFGSLAEMMSPRLRQMHMQQIQLFRQHRLVAPTDQTTEKMRYPGEKSRMGWNADQWAQDVYDKLNAGLLGVALSFVNGEGESRFSYMTNQRLSGQRLSARALESLKADYAKQHEHGFIPAALYTVSLGEDWQFRQNGLAKLFERHEDGYSMVCECALPLPEEAHLNEKVLSEIRRSEERLYEKKLHPLFRDAANLRTVMEEIAALGGKVTYNQDASSNLPAPHEEPEEDIPTGKSETGLSGSFGQGGRR